MARFYLDENMPIPLVAELQAFGHGVVTADDLRLKRAGDDEQLWVAAQNGWVLVTRDHDYRLLHDAWQRWGVAIPHAGILITPHPWTPKEAALELHVFVQLSQPLVNQLYEWKQGVWALRS